MSLWLFLMDLTCTVSAPSIKWVLPDASLSSLVAEQATKEVLLSYLLFKLSNGLSGWLSSCCCISHQRVLMDSPSPVSSLAFEGVLLDFCLSAPAIKGVLPWRHQDCHICQGHPWADELSCPFSYWSFLLDPLLSPSWDEHFVCCETSGAVSLRGSIRILWVWLWFGSVILLDMFSNECS